ncbi:MAG: type VI secretion system-associated FHA domain protein, partial [Vicinamibacterales bacterium]
MILTLEVTGPEAGKLGTGSRKVFNAAGGTIGRLQDNSWVLPDQYVSGRHALIRYVNGIFYIEDTSRTNGVFINSPENRLARGEPYALQAGDRIIIEPYEILTSISAGDEEKARSPLLDVFGAPPVAIPADAGDPFAPIQPLPPKAVPGRGAPDVDYGLEPLPAEEVDPMNLLGLDAKRPAPKDVPNVQSLSAGSVLSEHYSAPAPVPAAPEPASPAHGAMIPEDYNPLASDSVILKPVPPPVAPAPAPAPARA